MAVAGPAFVTPHAVQRFQRRVAPLPYRHALAAIIKGIEHAERTYGGKTITYHVARPYRFRALVRPSTEPDQLPVVVTVVV